MYHEKNFYFVSSVADVCDDFRATSSLGRRSRGLT